jgi:hypothetical protein
VNQVTTSNARARRGWPYTPNGKTRKGGGGYAADAGAARSIAAETTGPDLLQQIQLASWGQFRRLVERSRIGCRRDLAVAELREHLEYLAAGWEHAAARSLIPVECMHELDFVVTVIALASGGVDLTAADDFGPAFKLPPFDDNRFAFLATIRTLAAILRDFAAIDGCPVVESLGFGHAVRPFIAEAG